MRKPMTLGPLTAEEQQAVQAGLRSSQSVIGRRCHMLLASQRGCHARHIADQLRGGDQTVRHILHAGHRRGIASLQPQSKVPRHRPQAVFEAARREQLGDLLQQRPRALGYPTSRWTLPLAAQVAYAAGISSPQGSAEAIRPALQPLRGGGKRATHWIHSPEPGYGRKKHDATG